MQIYNKNQIFFAGFWVRLAAFTIDSAICGGFFLAVYLGSYKSALFQRDILFCYSLRDIAFYIGSALYYILCTYYTGTTLGKRLMNLRVISTAEGGGIPLTDVIYRETAGRFLSGCIMAAGYLLIAADKEKRGLHDVLCDTRVVYVKKIGGRAAQER